MRFSRPRLSWPSLVLTSALTVFSVSAKASLTAYTPNGRDLVRLQQGPVDITLTADGNLFKTLLDDYAAANGGDTTGLVTAIIGASGGALSDTFYGTWTLTAADFGADGSVSWFGAKALINYLNATAYGGSNQWRLPTATDTAAAGCDFGFSGTDCGYNVDPASGELARLYYSELLRSAAFDTGGSPLTGYGIFANDGAQVPGGAVGPFVNVRSDAYWAGTEYGPGGALAWVFGTLDGYQGFDGKQNMFFAWAVTPGEVTAVPLPAAAWMFGSALLGLIGVRRSRSAKSAAA